MKEHWSFFFDMKEHWSFFLKKGDQVRYVASSEIFVVDRIDNYSSGDKALFFTCELLFKLPLDDNWEYVAKKKAEVEMKNEDETLVVINGLPKFIGLKGSVYETWAVDNVTFDVVRGTAIHSRLCNALYNKQGVKVKVMIS